MTDDERFDVIEEEALTPEEMTLSEQDLWEEHLEDPQRFWDTYVWNATW